MASKKQNWILKGDRIRNVHLPDKIQCEICRKYQMHQRYSNNQLDKYRYAISTNGQSTSQRPTCNKCSGGGPTTEFKCYQCNITKARDKFTKTQLRDPDHAKCNDCQQDISDQEPNLKDALEEESIKEEMDTHKSVTGSTAFSLEELRSQLPSYSAASSARARSSAATSQTSSDGVYMQHSNGTEDSQGSDDDTVSTSTSTVSRSHAPSVTSNSSAGTIDTRGLWSSIGSQSGYMASRSGNARQGNASTSAERFASNKAAKPDAFERAQKRITREEQQRAAQVEEEETVVEDDSDDDDSDFEAY